MRAVLLALLLVGCGAPPAQEEADLLLPPPPDLGPVGPGERCNPGSIDVCVADREHPCPTVECIQPAWDTLPDDALSARSDCILGRCQQSYAFACSPQNTCLPDQRRHECINFGTGWRCD